MTALTVVVVVVGAVVVVRLISPDAETSLPATVEVHGDLVAVFVDELDEEPATVEVGFSDSDRCEGLFSWLFGATVSQRALWLETRWTADQDLSSLDAAISAAREYLVGRDGEAEGLRSDVDGATFFASADVGGVSLGDDEASGGGSADGAYVRTISTACVDPESTDLSEWEALLESSMSST